MVLWEKAKNKQLRAKISLFKTHDVITSTCATPTEAIPLSSSNAGAGKWKLNPLSYNNP
jgi:hypothetical protein